MEFLLIGIVTFFNIVIIIHKFRESRYADATLDTAIMIALCFVFGGSYGALVVGMVASAGISLYLFWKPVYLPKLF